MENFVKIVKNRNLREWIACAIVIPSFLYMGLQKETFLGKIFCFEIALAGIFIVYYLYIKSHKKLRQAIEKKSSLNKVVKDEMNLLLTVKYWYVLPIFLGLIGLTLEELYISFNNDNSLVGGLVYLVSIFGLGAFIIYLNENKGVKELEVYLNN